jgi:hypothetical protein
MARHGGENIRNNGISVAIAARKCRGAAYHRNVMVFGNVAGGASGAVA